MRRRPDLRAAHRRPRQPTAFERYVPRAAESAAHCPGVHDVRVLIVRDAMVIEPQIDADDRTSIALPYRWSALIRGVCALALPWALGAQQASTPVQRAPVLSMPAAGLDDTASYQGYKTRFFRDSRGNVLQIYLEPR